MPQGSRVVWHALRIERSNILGQFRAVRLGHTDRHLRRSRIDIDRRNVDGEAADAALSRRSGPCLWPSPAPGSNGKRTGIHSDHSPCFRMTLRPSTSKRATGSRGVEEEIDIHIRRRLIRAERVDRTWDPQQRMMRSPGAPSQFLRRSPCGSIHCSSSVKNVKVPKVPRRSGVPMPASE